MWKPPFRIRFNLAQQAAQGSALVFRLLGLSFAQQKQGRCNEHHGSQQDEDKAFAPFEERGLHSRKLSGASRPINLEVKRILPSGASRHCPRLAGREAAQHE